MRRSRSHDVTGVRVMTLEQYLGSQRGVLQYTGIGAGSRCHEWAGSPPLPTTLKAANQKRQTVMVITGAASEWEYLPRMTDQSLKRQSTFDGGKDD